MSETSEGSGSSGTPRTGGAADPWEAFLAERASLIFQVVRLFERDPDEVEDGFLFVCERLREGNLRRIRLFREAGAASFETWLRAVIRRLCLDWRRHRDGRFRLPRAVARLPDLEQEVFRALHLRGLTRNEAFHVLVAMHPALTREALDRAAAVVARSVDATTRWRLLVRRPRMQSLSTCTPDADPAEVEVGLVDPRAGPEDEAAAHQRQEALRTALAGLPPRDRLLLRLRYEEELPLEEVARLTGLGGSSQAERHLQQALESLRSRMGLKGPPGLSVKEERT